MKLTNFEKAVCISALALIFAALGWYMDTLAENSAHYVPSPVLTVTDGEDGQSDLIDINTAGPRLLQTLDGIGEKTAEAIIEYRTEKGGFDSIEEIMNVTGIGEKKFQAIQSRITVSCEENDN